jgi:phosphatidyl-myo-inositol dimannoside synthase
LIKKILHIPYVIFLHGTDINMATKSRFKFGTFKKVCRFAEKIVVNSHFLEEKVKNVLKEYPPLVVIYPSSADFFFTAVSPEKISLLKAKLALTGKKVVLTVARMCDGKGYPHFVRLLPELLKRIPNLIWVIVGTGPKEKEIRDAVTKNSLQNIVRFLGVIPQAELPAYYQMADLFVLLTHPDEKHEEGFGTVFLEAAASRLPVVAGRAGGVEEAVEDLKTGIVVDINQELQITGTIEGLLKNIIYAKQLGEAARERAEREFTWEKQMKKLEI